ncbi:MAG: thiamine phosphate synthase [Thiotrichaceae bacterium]|nr:thiamine phosphate synthase [Thiotrichaceae bacterium]
MSAPFAHHPYRNDCFHGLYAITHDVAQLSATALCGQVVAAIEGGARIIQYRHKNLSASQREQQARALLDCCRERAIPLIINDDVALATTIGADGVHLGKDDMTIATARAQLGEQAIIGTSCYNLIDLATAAQQAGANYVAFGRFFASTTKPLAIEASPALLQQAKTQLNVPIIAIGGITAENGRILIDAGADMLAAINGVFAATDIRVAAQQYAQLFK